MNKPGPTKAELLRRVGDLEQRLQEAEANLEALRRHAAAGEPRTASPRKKAAKLTASQQAQEREILRQASFPQMNPSPVLEADTAGRITYFNQAARATIDKFGGAVALHDFLPGDFDEIVATARMTGEQDFRREVQVADAYFLVTVSHVEMFNTVRIYAIDITQRKRAEEALMRAKREWERTFDAVPDLIAILDSDHRILRGNRAMAQALGVEPKDLVGKICYEQMHRTACPPDLCPHSRLLQDGRGHVAELREFDLDLLVTVSPLRDDQGRLLGSVHVARDITARKRSEQALKQAHHELEHRVAARTAELQQTVAQLQEEVTERLEAERQTLTSGRLYRFLSKVNETIVRARDRETLYREVCRVAVEEGLFRMAWVGLVDPANQVVKAAAQYGFVEGYLDNLVIPLADVPESRGPTGIAVRESRLDICNDFAAESRMAPWREQALARGYRSSGAFPLRVGESVVGALTFYAASPGFFNDEEIALLESLAGDLSFALEAMDQEDRRRQAEAEIKKLNEELEARVRERTAQLEAANQELEAFSYSVSHDLKAPIRAIDGFSRMLMLEHGSQLDAEARRLLEVIRHNTDYMGRLIDDLLALSRLGRHELRKAWIDLATLSANAFRELEAQAPERNLDLTIKELPPAFGDPSLLNQVMVNLLTNACKYTKFEETASIEVGGWRAGGENVYYVKDNGVGFDMRFANKLFGVFQRLHGTNDFEGTGVGLAIVQRILQRHGGRVWAEGKVSEGAIFYFALPMAEE